jgi:hypothetical protein
MWYNVQKGIIANRVRLVQSYIYSIRPATIIVVKLQQVMNESDEVGGKIRLN